MEQIRVAENVVSHCAELRVRGDHVSRHVDGVVGVAPHWAGKDGGHAHGLFEDSIEVWNFPREFGG